MSADADALADFIRVAMPEKGEAFVVPPACGAVFIGAAATPFDGSDAETDEAALCTYLQAHEFVHLTQILSTRSCRWYAADQLRIATRLELARLRGEEIGSEERQMMLEILGKGMSIMRRRENELPSMADIMETHAVIEGWKVSPYAKNEFSLVVSILHNSHCMSVEYSGIIGYWMQRPKLMLELLPRICWLALQDLDPATCYAKLIALPEYCPEEMIRGLKTRHIAQIFNMEKSVHDGIWNSFPDYMLPLWQDYMSELHRIVEDDPTWDTLACPSLLEDRSRLMPSLFIFDNGFVRVDGPAKGKENSKSYKWLVAAELVSRNIAELRSTMDSC